MPARLAEQARPVRPEPRDMIGLFAAGEGISIPLQSRQVSLQRMHKLHPLGPSRGELSMHMLMRMAIRTRVRTGVCPAVR